MNEAERIAQALSRLADKVNPFDSPGQDASGGYVGCVVEALMGHTAGLFAIAESIDNLADAMLAARNGKEEA